MPIRQEDLEPDAPTEEEFLRSFNLDIERLKDEGTVTNIDSVSALEEMPIEEEVEVLCSPVIEEFVTYVNVQFDGNAAALMDMEVSILSILFEQVYNELTFQGCGSYFRMTDDTLLVPPATGTESGYFRVLATCRNCPVNQNDWFSLFANTRRLLEDMQNNLKRETPRTSVRSSKSRVRGLQVTNQDVCFCPALSGNLVDPSPAAPSINEMQQEFCSSKRTWIRPAV